MFYVPGTPHQRALEHIRALYQFRSTPEAPEAVAAFDRFLELGSQREVLDSTVVAALTGAILVLVVPFARRIVAVELLFVVLGFVLAQLWVRGESPWDPLSWISGLCLGLALSAVRMSRRNGPDPIAESAPRSG